MTLTLVKSDQLFPSVLRQWGSAVVSLHIVNSYVSPMAEHFLETTWQGTSQASPSGLATRAEEVRGGSIPIPDFLKRRRQVLRIQ